MVSARRKFRRIPRGRSRARPEIGRRKDPEIFEGRNLEKFSGQIPRSPFHVQKDAAREPKSACGGRQKTPGRGAGKSRESFGPSLGWAMQLLLLARRFRRALPSHLKTGDLQEPD